MKCIEGAVKLQTLLLRNHIDDRSLKVLASTDGRGRKRLSFLRRSRRPLNLNHRGNELIR